MKTLYLAMFYLIILFSLSSCSDKEIESNTVQTNYFTVSQLTTTGLHFDSIINYKYCNATNHYYIFGYSPEYSNFNTSYDIFICDDNFENTHSINMGLKTNERISKWDIDENGNLIALITETKEIMDENDPLIIRTETNVYLKYYNFYNDNYNNIHLQDFYDDNSAISDIFLFDNNAIVINTYNFEDETNRFVKLNGNGQLISTYSFDNISWIESIAKTQTGVSLIYYSTDKKYLGTIDFEKYKLNNIYSFSESNETLKLLTSRNTSEYYIVTPANILKIDSNGCNEYCNLSVLGFNGSNIHCVEIASNNDIIMLEYDSFSSNRYMYKLVNNDISFHHENQNQQILTIAYGWIDDLTKSELVRINKSNDSYKIVLKDYSQYNNSDNPDAGMKQLELDLINNTAPDIILYSSFQNARTLENLGAFADLYEIMNNDNEFDNSLLLDNVLQAFQYKGKLYSIPVDFKILTMCGLTKSIGDKSSWNIQRMINLYENNTSYTKLMCNNNKRRLTENILLNNIGVFVNYERKECYFNSEEFSDLINFIQEIGSNDDCSDNSFDIANEDALLDMVYISNFEEFHKYLAGYCNNQEVSFVGFPTSNSHNSLILSELQLAINAKSSQKELAWKFLKKILSYEFQKDIINKFPINKEVFYERAKTATIIPKDNAGNDVENIFNLDKSPRDIGYLTDTEKKECIDLVLETNKSLIYDINIYRICEEEFAPFIDNNQTANETVQRIQQRVSLYLNELK